MALVSLELGPQFFGVQNSTLRAAVPEALGMRIQRCADVQRKRMHSCLFLQAVSTLLLVQ